MRDVRAQLDHEIKGVTESRVQEVEDAVKALKAIPEVVFVSRKDGALYAEDIREIPSG